VSLAASDTFARPRGAARDLAQRRARISSRNSAAQIGAVAFDAVASATARGSDVLIVDTARRLPPKTPLMDELAR
jgi:fused signal recognition particle receptor